MTSTEIDELNGRLLHYVRPELSKASEQLIAYVRKRSGRRLMVAQVEPVLQWPQRPAPNARRNELFKQGHGIQFAFVSRDGHQSWSINDPFHLIEEAAILLGLDWGGDQEDEPEPYFVSMPTPDYEMPPVDFVSCRNAGFLERLGFRIGIWEVGLLAIFATVAYLVIANLAN